MICAASSTFIEADDCLARDFILETNAASTLDAAFAVEEDQVAQRDVLVHLELVIEEEAALALEPCSMVRF